MNTPANMNEVITHFGLVRDDAGFMVWPDGHQFAGISVDMLALLRLCEFVELGYPYGSDSFDSTIWVGAPNGDVYRVSNPGQACYPVYWSAE